MLEPKPRNRQKTGDTKSRKNLLIVLFFFLIFCSESEIQNLGWSWRVARRSCNYQMIEIDSLYSYWCARAQKQKRKQKKDERPPSRLAAASASQQMLAATVAVVFRILWSNNKILFLLSCVFARRKSIYLLFFVFQSSNHA